jgi:type II secretory pathway component PulF
MRAEDRSQFDPDAAPPAARSWFAPVVCLTHAATFFLLFVELMFVVPRFESMFRDLDANLPDITLIVLAASNAMRSFWFLVALLWLGSIAGLIGLHRAGGRRAAWVMNWVACAAALGFAAFAVLGIWVPYSELRQLLQRAG